ncbi:MAG: hypothetical protein J0L53_19530 [Spirochaetes bacterium]|nr:hypothetical protein [Spirochaetota bacterium]
MRNSRVIVGFTAFLALVACKRGNPTKPPIPHLGAIQPAHQYFHIDPNVKNILKGEKGSLFTIEPGVFALGEDYKAGDKIEIEIVEVTQPLEFAALPVSLEFNDGGNETLFESAGMFYVGASYGGKPLTLKADQKIQVKFRTNVRGKKFFVYNYDAAKGWQRHGHNQEKMLEPTLIAQAANSEARDSQPVEISGRRRGPRKAVPPAKYAVAAPAVAAPAVRELYRIYDIDRLAWWNFDYPQPNLTCLKGTLVGATGDQASVTVFSKKPLGAYTLYLPKDFRISFYRDTKARLFAIDEKGNIGRTGLFETPDTEGHHKRKDLPCEDLGKVNLAPVPAAVANDPKKMREYLGKGE